MIKLATWNVNSITVRLQQLIDWLQTEKPNLIALQETKIIDEKFPLQALQEVGYHAVFAGQKSYNGVALLSQSKATAIEIDNPFFADPHRRMLAATVHSLRVINIYVPNGSQIGTDKYFYKLD